MNHIFRTKSLDRQHLSTLHFVAGTLSRTNEKTITYPLYPFDSTELGIIFVYGEDFRRETNIMFFPASIRIQATVIVSFIVLSAYILRKIRQECKLRGSSFVSTFMDILIAFISGGNLGMQHKLERIFFGILLIGAFFIMSIFGGDLLDCVYNTLNQKIEKFEQLVELNPPIYFNPSLTTYKDLVFEMLR